MDIVAKYLLVLVVVQSVIIFALHFFYNWQVHKLLDKLMSRDYRDYHTTIAPPKKEPKVPVMPEVPEDLRVLQGFQIP